jgi:hypothetical protein
MHILTCYFCVSFCKEAHYTVGNYSNGEDNCILKSQFPLNNVLEVSLYLREDATFPLQNSVG